MQTVGVIGMGQMGSGIATVLSGGGLRVVTTLGGRRADTITRAHASGAEVGDSMQWLVESANIVLSIVPPAQARVVADEVAGAIASAGSSNLTYIDFNAVSPRTVEAIEATLVDVGADFADGCIIGQSPHLGHVPAMPVCGPAAAAVSRGLGGLLDIREIGGPSGRASALKMCWAALTKVTSAHYLDLLVAADRLGVADELWDQMRATATMQIDIMDGSMPRIPPKAARWIGEMHEIADTFESVGLSPAVPRQAADVYSRLAAAADSIERPADVPTIVSHLV